MKVRFKFDDHLTIKLEGDAVFVQRAANAIIAEFGREIREAAATARAAGHPIQITENRDHDTLRFDIGE